MNTNNINNDCDCDCDRDTSASAIINGNNKTNEAVLTIMTIIMVTRIITYVVS